MAELEILVFTTSFCGSCAATLERVRSAAQLVGSERVAWREVNVATDPGVAESAGIDVTPTVVLVDSDGREVMRAVGVPSVDQVLGAVARHLPAQA